jgi:hypothetical protein
LVIVNYHLVDVEMVIQKFLELLLRNRALFFTQVIKHLAQRVGFVHKMLHNQFFGDMQEMIIDGFLL